MQLAIEVLGSTAVDQLTKNHKEQILVVGKDKFTRADLGGIGCFNFIAAKNLSVAFQALQVKNLQDVFDNVAPSALALPHVGTISLAVLGAAFEAKGIGGSSPLAEWVGHHLNGKIRTFNTVKHKIRAMEGPRKKRRHRR
jgi:hypothetical protein